MNKWCYPWEHPKRDEVEIAVGDQDWQEFRKQLKGLRTEVKLDCLKAWRDYPGLFDSERRLRRIQTDNYIGALRRGGQLNLNNEVQR